jgi:multidrug efflux system outer membrane protein
MKRQLKKSLLGSLLVALLAGCTVGPDYVRKAFETPVTWRVTYPQAAELSNLRWWEQFEDPVLNGLIETALLENRDIRVAAARVDQYLGQLATTRSQFFPQLGYGLDVSRNKMSQRSISAPPAGTDLWYKQYQGSVSADWQIDLFGRVRRQTEAAQALVYSSEEGRRGTLLTVVSSVASSYVTLRALDRKLEIARATAANYEGSLKIFQARYKGGVVSQVEVSQIESQYQQALAAVPALERQVAAQENLLSVLLGRAPESIQRGKTIEALLLPQVPPGLPSSLIERRPDVLAAEQNLVAANANIGVTRSLYFPTISLTGMLGSLSTAMSTFMTGPAGVAMAAASLSGPIFTFGNIEGQVRSAEAGEQEAVARYQQTILVALRETNDALIGAQKAGEAYEAQARRVTVLREYARLSRLRFENGSASYLEVYSAENELFGAELTAVDGSADRILELVSIYKALGGGWVDAADALTKPPVPVRSGATEDEAS